MAMSTDAELAKQFIDYMRGAAPNSFVFCMGGSALHNSALAAGQPVVREFYADRDYDDSGSIVFIRDASRPDPEKLANKCLLACREGRVKTVSGGEIGIEFESICVHSDTPGALNILAAIRKLFSENGIRITPVSELVAA